MVWSLNQREKELFGSSNASSITIYIHKRTMTVFSSLWALFRYLIIACETNVFVDATLVLLTIIGLLEGRNGAGRRGWHWRCRKDWGRGGGGGRRRRRSTPTPTTTTTRTCALGCLSLGAHLGGKLANHIPGGIVTARHKQPLATATGHGTPNLGRGLPHKLRKVTGG